MFDKDKIAHDLAEIIQLMDKSVDTDIDSQRRTSRELDLKDWNEEQARQIASSLGIELSYAHLQVVHALREQYRQYGETRDGRQLGDFLDQAFTDMGGRKYLRRLFPDGPVKEGMLIAGLPVPLHTEDRGFGTAR